MRLFLAFLALLVATACGSSDRPPPAPRVTADAAVAADTKYIRVDDTVPVFVHGTSPSAPLTCYLERRGRIEVLTRYPDQEYRDRYGTWHPYAVVQYTQPRDPERTDNCHSGELVVIDRRVLRLMGTRE